jgi:citrate lyase subunit beta / citryl-CoA lyase
MGANSSGNIHAMTPLLMPRSYLFAPGTKPALFPKAVASGADQVILDLEDAVGEAHKAEARAAVAAWLEGGSPVAVRINAASTRWSAADAAVCRHPNVAAVVMPKVEDPDEVRSLTSRLAPSTPVIPMIESAQGLKHAEAIASVPGVLRLAFGSLDFQFDLGIPDDVEGLRAFRSHLVLVSRLAGVGSPVDGITRRFDEAGPVQADTARAQALGFGAKLCIHPRQVAWVNAGFSPTADEIAWATRVLDADRASAGAATAIDDGMIDRPVMLRAQAILARAART